MKTAYRKWMSQKLIQLRDEKKLTQAQLARDLQVNLKVYQSYEEGRAQPAIPFIVKVSKHFGISLDQFMVDCPTEITR